jgi:hypothetical protein
MGHLLLALCLLAATADMPAPPQKAQKASPTHKKRAPRAKPPAQQQPSAPAPTPKTKTAMA